MEVSNTYTIGLRDLLTEGNVDWYDKTIQLHVANEVIDFRKEPTTTTYLNKFNSQMHSKFSPLYSTVTAVSLIKKACLCCRWRPSEKGTPDKNTAPIDLSKTQPTYLRLKEHCTKRDRNIVRSKGL